MRELYDSNSQAVKQHLKAKKFRINDPLSEQLVKSLCTKIFYTLAHYKMFDTLTGTISIGPVAITPYQSIVGDIRYIVEFFGLYEKPTIVHWNGKFDVAGKNKHSAFFINIEDFNVTNRLPPFVEFEQKVVKVLHDIEDQFFNVVKVDNTSDEIPAMHSHVDEEQECK